ncbi:MAG: 1,4-dihydroxy-2-naphthoate polyprenyltransferase [Chlorobi bacterium]|nr:1,4-dihydroxy-2-naphthoate polyprenyltransferase [Chlorobiota bacterium]
MISNWISAFRLRTLPLSLSTIFTGSFLAYFYGYFRIDVLLWASLTTLFLQILSNLANDYGDYVSGADGKHRKGPDRMMQSGRITAEAMKKAIAVFAVLSFLSGITLLYVTFRGRVSLLFVMFVLLGIGAIAAAMKYTMGKNPYGYRGLGDLFVFIFFGLVGVAGTYFLHSLSLNVYIWLPAVSVGLLSSGVLNVNNIRDEESDRVSGKNTLVVMMGGKKARIYHIVLVNAAVILLVIFTLLQFRSSWQFLFLLTLPLFFKHLSVVVKNYDNSKLDPELKRLALLTFFTVLLFGLGMMLS